MHTHQRKLARNTLCFDLGTPVLVTLPGDEVSGAQETTRFTVFDASAWPVPRIVHPVVDHGLMFADQFLDTLLRA